MVFAPRYPGRGERRVQCLEWTHPIQLGYAHLTEGRMPAALHRGRPNPLARQMQTHQDFTTQLLGLRMGKEVEQNLL